MKHRRSRGPVAARAGAGELAAAEADRSLTRWEILLVSTLMLLGLALRLGAFLERSDAATFVGLGDSAYYIERAQEVRTLGPISTQAYFMSPGYPMVLALSGAKREGGLWPAILAQTALGLFAVACLARVARRLRGPTAGLITLALGVVAAPLVLYDTSVLSDGPATALAAIAAAGLTLPPRPLARLRLWGAGVTVAVAVALRPNLLLLALGLAAWVAWSRNPDEHRLRRVGAVLAPVVVVLGVISVGNYLAEELPAPVSYNSGLNLYAGNNSRATGAYSFVEGVSLDDPSGRRVVEQARGRAVGSDEVDRFWRSRALEFFRREPGEAARLFLRKAVLVWAPYEIPQTENLDLERMESLALRGAVVGFGLLLPLACLGSLTLTRRERVAAIPLLLPAAVAWLTCVVFFVNGRLRLPIWCALLPLAGIGVDHLIRGARQEPLGRTARRVVALGVLGALPWLIPFPRQWYRANQSSMYAMTEALAGSPVRARAWLARERTFAAEMPGDPLLALERGKALYALEDYSASFGALRVAADRLPDHTAAQVGLLATGRKLIESGRADPEVRAAMERARRRLAGMDRRSG